MKRGIIKFGLLLLIIALQCTQTGNQLATTGGSEVVGKVVTPTNKPVNNALVRVFKIPDTIPGDSTFSNGQGEYKFDSLEIGSYNILMKGKFEGDSLYGYHANVPNDVIAAKGQPPHRVDVGTDTMHAPGKISGRAVLQPGDATPITCYIPGSSYHAITDDTGAFTISFVPAGVYRVYYVDFSGIYQKAIDSGITVVSDQTKKLADKVMLLSPVGAPPAPKALKLQYDLPSGQVTATWNSVNVSDLQNYIILRQVGAAGVFDTVGRVSKSQTSFIDAVYINASDTLDHLCTYEIFSEDSGGLTSVTPAIDTISVTSPSNARTFVSMYLRPSVNSSSDTVAVNAMVMVSAEFVNQSVQVQKLVWSVEKPDSIVRTSVVNANAGKDSLQVAFKQSGFKTIYLKAMDAAGQTRIDSLPLSVIQDAPVIIYCSQDTSIDFGGAFQCSVAVGHRFGACSLLVDFNHDGKFEFKRKAAGLDTIVNTNTATAWGKVAIRISDSHGNFIDAGFVVTINPPIQPHWEQSSPLNYPRKWLSTCVINNKIYAIGGLKKYVRPGSTTNLSKAASYVEELDSVWTPSDSLKIGRYGFSLGIYNNSAYVFGGMGIKGATKSIEQFDPAHSSWTMLTDTMPFFRAGAASCVMGAKLYLFGGRIPSTIDTISDSVCNAIYTFDFAAKQWHEIPGRMNTRRSDFQAVNIRDKIYLIGGWDDAGNILSDVEIFDTVSQKCASGISLPTPRYDFAAVSFKDSIYVIGGNMNTDGDSYYNDIYRFSPSTNWQQITTFPEPAPNGMYGMSASVVKGAIVIVGGSSSSSTNDPGFASSLVRKYYP